MAWQSLHAEGAGLSTWHALPPGQLCVEAETLYVVMDFQTVLQPSKQGERAVCCLRVSMHAGRQRRMRQPVPSPT